MRGWLIQNKSWIKPNGYILLFVYLYLWFGSKGIDTTPAYNLFMVLAVFMNSVTIIWFTASIFNSSWRNKETVSVFTPFISATLIKVAFFAIIFYAYTKNT